MFRVTEVLNEKRKTNQESVDVLLYLKLNPNVIYGKTLIYICNITLYIIFPFLPGYSSRFLRLKDGDPVFLGPCHHGVARPQVADGGTASDMEGSCE